MASGTPPGHYLIRILAIGWLQIALLLLLAAPSRAECGHQRVVVVGSADESAVTCVALHSVLAYFDGLGFVVDPQIRIVFIDRLPINNDGIALAFLDRASRTIEIARPGAIGTDNLLLWGIGWSGELMPTVLLHELVHAVVDQIAPERVPGILAEFVGSAVQFELVAPPLRERILAGYGRLHTYSTFGGEMSADFAIEPQAFGVRAYLFEQAHGGAALIRGLLDGSITPGGAGDSSWRPYLVGH